jgi:nucleotidyltransferase/DNA polymerase involved in DNA repair
MKIASLPGALCRQQVEQGRSFLCGKQTKAFPQGGGSNKFLAKIASDWRKPDGLFVIQPDDVDVFLSPLPEGRLPGVGKVTGEKLAKLEIQTVGNLKALDLQVLEQHFGRYGLRLYELARGIDDNEVIPDRPTQSISVEDTLAARTPKALASYEAAQTTERFACQATITGLPRRSGLSRCSTEA